MDQQHQQQQESQPTNYDNVGALVRALHETGTSNTEQLRLPLEDSPFRRNGLLSSSSRLSPQYHRSSLPSVTVTCSDENDEGSSNSNGQPKSPSQNNNNNHLISLTARRFSHFHFDFGLRRFSTSVRIFFILCTYFFVYGFIASF